MRRLELALDWAADHVGDVYLLVLAVIVAASIVVVVVASV